MNFDLQEIKNSALKALQIWHSTPNLNSEPAFRVVLTSHIQWDVKFRWMYLGQEGHNWVYALHAQDVLEYVLAKEAEDRAIEATRNQLTNQFKN